MVTIATVAKLLVTKEAWLLDWPGGGAVPTKEKISR